MPLATLTGDASTLKLNTSDRHAYLRAVEFLATLNIALDHAAREYAEIRIMLGRQGDTSGSLPRLVEAHRRGAPCCWLIRDDEQSGAAVGWIYLAMIRLRLRQLA
jgi:hypothetical protein